MLRYALVCSAILCLSLSLTATAQEAKPAEAAAATSTPVSGQLTLGEKTLKLTHIVAYETKPGDETRLNILMSDRKVPVDPIKAALAENDGSDQSLLLDQPYLKIVFGKSGKAAHITASVGGTTIAGNDDGLEGEVKVENGRAKGQAKVEEAGEGVFKRSLTATFDVGVGLDQAPKKIRPAGPVKPTVSGKFIGNGKEAKLAYISAYQGEDFADKPSVTLVLTELDHTKDKKPDFKAGFGDYGCALVLSIHENGKIFGCQVAHTGLEKKSISSVGQISTSEFDLGDGQISGLIKTDGELEFFGDKWEVDLKFAAPFAGLKTATKVAAADEPTPKKTKKSKKKSADEPAEDKPKPDTPAEPAGDVLNIYDLAIPEDATDLEYKKVVKHFAFSSPKPYKDAAQEFSKLLEKQGWEVDGSDLYGVSVILKRKRGPVKMTIFVKPNGTGSKASMFASDLDWTEKKKEEK